MSDSTRRPRWPWRRFIAGAVVVAGVCGTPRRAETAGTSRQGDEAQAMFQAERRLAGIGIGAVAPLSPSRSGGEHHPRSSPSGVNIGGVVYLARIRAPALAFLHGLCDGSGGLPKHGDSVTVMLQPEGGVEFRATSFGQILDVGDRPTELWIWDDARLGDRMRVRRSVEARQR
jgi:hypothetical protein